MKEMTEIVERKDKPFVRVFLAVVGSVIFINFVMFLANKFVGRYPYLTNIIVIFFLIFTCSLILIKYFSKYSYTLEDEKLIFHRFIGKKSFEMLNVDLNDILYIKPYNQSEKKNFNYKLIFDKDYKDCYVGKFKNNEKCYYFIFKPSLKMINELKK